MLWLIIEFFPRYRFRTGTAKPRTGVPPACGIHLLYYQPTATVVRGRQKYLAYKLKHFLRNRPEDWPPGSWARNAY